MPALWNWETCLPAGKRRHVAALQSRSAEIHKHMPPRRGLEFVLGLICYKHGVPPALGETGLGAAMPRRVSGMKMKKIFALLLCLAAAFCAWGADLAATNSTVLGIRGGEFTVNDNAVFLLGFSYYGALGAAEDTVRRDLDDAQRLGFNWLRVWATWNAFDANVSAVAAGGAGREPFLGRLKWLVAECDRRGLIVDVTLSRGETLPNFAAHQRAVETLVEALHANRNWYFDLANEHDFRDARQVSNAELKQLRDEVRRLDASRLATASFAGSDLAEKEARETLLAIGLDFLAPHRPRNAKSPRETEARTRELRAAMQVLGHVAPILYQEPFRRGYKAWEPRAEDFLDDLQGARAGGAAGWCFHNGQQSDTKGHEPGRSFDLRKVRLFDQLDAEEQKVVRQAAAAVNGRRGTP